MPTYEYECSGCREAYDVLQRMSDPVLAACIKCGSENVTKKLSVPTILVRRAEPQTTADTEDRPGPYPPVARFTPSGQLIVDGNVPPDFRHPRLGGRSAIRAGE